MWLLFDNNGKLTKQVEYSKLAYLTSTNFYLFCVFSGIDGNDLGAATLSLKKPSGELLTVEISGTIMSRKFEAPDKDLESSYLPFVDGTTYEGANFSFTDSAFLDEIGLWKGTITFYTSDGTRNISGAFLLNVCESAVNADSRDITYDEYLSLLSEIAQKQNHLYAGAGIGITNGIISVTVDVSGGQTIDLSKYVTLEYLADYHDSSKQDLIDENNKIPVAYVEGITSVTKVSQLENDAGYATVDYVNSIIPDEYDDTAVCNRLNAIEALIPSEASAMNELADKAYVDDSISTSTATFKGTFESLDTLKATSADSQDYAYYKHVDSIGNTIYSRYKYSDGAWTFEYDLNNTGFTAAQWSNINADLSVYATESYVQGLTWLPDQNCIVKTINTQVIKIWDLPVGFYKLTYNGNKLFDLDISTGEAHISTIYNTQTVILEVWEISFQSGYRKCAKTHSNDWTKVVLFYLDVNSSTGYGYLGGVLNEGSPIEYVNWTFASNIWAPTANGTSGQLLMANGGNNAPTWATLDLSDYVKTDDARLSDARTPLAHTHTASEVTDFSDEVNSLIETYMSENYENGNTGSY